MARVEMFQHARVALQPNDGVSDIQPQRDWNGNSHVQQGILGFLGTAVTLSSQAFVATDALHVVAASSGSADTLASITATNNLTNDWIQLLPHSGHTITVSHGTGNIFLQGAVNKVIDSHVGMILRYDGTNWYEWGNYSAAITSASNTFTNGQTISPATLTALTLNLPTGPTGSSSKFIGGISVPANTVAFATTPQTGDYKTNEIGQATLTNPSTGTIANAASLDIIGAPIAGTNVTITNAYSLRVLAGTTLLQATTMAGTLTMSGANIALGSNSITTLNYTLKEGTTGLFSNLFGVTSDQLSVGLFIQPSFGNGFAELDLFRTNDIITNYEVLRIGTDQNISASYDFIATKGGSGSYRDINFWNNATELLTLSALGTIKMYVPIATYNNIATAGLGVPAIYGSTKQKSETGADANVLTYTPPAVAGRYRITFSADVSAASVATFGWTATWKDSNGTSQSPTNLAFDKAGSATINLTVSASANDHYYGDMIIDIDNSATNIVIKTTFTGTSIAYKVSAAIEQIA